MHFSMTMDQSCRAMTAAVFVVLVIALGPLWFFAFAFPASGAMHVTAASTTLFLVGGCALSWAMSPVGAELTAAGLLIRRRKFAPKLYRREDVTEVLPGPRRLGFRVAGVGGFFGCFGLYYAGGIGFYRLHSARLKIAEGAMLRRRTGEPVVIITDDGAAFRAALQTWMRPA